VKKRPYYSIRTGRRADKHLALVDLPLLRRLVCDVYKIFEAKDYFQEAFGYYCVDEGYVPGNLGWDVEVQVSLSLRKMDLWPIEDRCSEYSEDDLFDVIEFLFDCVSKPIDGYYHSFNNCGWHYSEFDQETGQGEFRAEINELLRDYENGYEISREGEILALAEPGLDHLYQADLPDYDPENVEKRVNAAVLKFRRYRSAIEDRRDAIRDLADVLEFLRPKLKQVLTSRDESDLFNIANNFGIRHHREGQKTNYDKSIWYSWMFYYYLATIHASLRLIKKYEHSASKE